MTTRLTVLPAGLVMAALMAVAAIALALPAHPAALGLGMKETPDDTWMTNGNVYTQALSGDGTTLYIGGKFTQVREKLAGTPGKTLAVDIG